MGIWTRLTDPDGIADAETLRSCNDKLSTCMTRMFQLAENGGNAFLFALAAPKPHYLRADLPCPTAATDGKSYFWHPDFITTLSYEEVTVVMFHESLHVAFFHPERMTSAQPRQRNWAMDYVVNGVIWRDHEQSKRKGTLWGGNLGKPVPLQELLDHIDGKVDAFPKGKEEEPRIFADKAVYGRSPESIYDEIMRHWEKSPRKCPECGALSMDPRTRRPKPPGPCKDRPACAHGGMCCPTCGSPLDAGGAGYGDGMPMPIDAHVPAKVTRQEAQADLLRAATQCKTSMRGSVPGEVEDALGELVKPTIRFTDIIRSSCMKKVQESGLKNDWKRMRRRWLVANPRQYLPKRHSHRPRWLAMVDTSGSMTDEDIAYGVSQLQVLGNTEGYVVPCDAGVNWDAVSPVHKVQDLKRVKIVGRGGTVFDSFFKEFPQHVGTQFDCIAVITDGDCGTVPAELAPRGIDVVWVLTRKQGSGWNQPFGRVVPLRVEGA